MGNHFNADDGELVYLAPVAAMAYELSYDVIRAAALTRQLQASEAGLRESEERFRIVADAAPVLIWMSGVDKLCPSSTNLGWSLPAVAWSRKWEMAGLRASPERSQRCSRLHGSIRRAESVCHAIPAQAKCWRISLDFR